jgi:RimJ/RimL family protein N-acetyltransferase
VAFCVDPDDATRATIGYTLAPEHRGHGYATEAVSALLAWLAQHGVAVVGADSLADNGPSRKILERLGFAAIAELDDGGVLYERTI